MAKVTISIMGSEIKILEINNDDDIGLFSNVMATMQRLNYRYITRRQENTSED